MKEINTEKIEIGGVEYTLFLNRKGLVAWEKFCKTELEEVENLKEKYQDVVLEEKEEKIEITDDTNPFEGLNELEEMDEDTKKISKVFRHLYWIMLYTNHQLNITKVNELYDEACNEYGENQLIALAQQMIEDINTNTIQSSELKNLPALRQKKN